MMDAITLKLRQDVEGLKAEITNTSPVLNSMKTEIDTFRSLFGKLESFTSFMSSHSKQDGEIASRIDKLEKQSSSHSSSMQKNQLLADRAVEWVAKLEEMFHQKCDEIDKLKQSIAQSPIPSSLEALKSELSRHKDEMNKSIESLKKESIVPASAILEKNSSFMQKLEIALLDCSNAILKLNNIETEIKIIGRRIEQHAQQFKKLELQQQR